MSYQLDGNDQFYCATSGLISAVPLTVVCWFKIASAPAAAQNILTIGESGGANNFFKLNVNASAQMVASSDVNSATDSNTLTTVSVSNDTWSMAAAVFASNASRRAYLNGTLDGDDTTSVATVWTAIDRFVIGGSSQFVNDFVGYIAHVQVYDKALSEAELDTLYGGTNPLSASTSSDLVGYWPLTADTTASVGNALSTNGSPVLAASDNPTVSAATTTYVKLVAPSDAVGETALEGVVLNAARDTVIGEFTGQEFVAGTGGDSGFAVLKIPVADITPNGSTLTTSDAPLVIAKNGTYGTVGHPVASVIEE